MKSLTGTSCFPCPSSSPQGLDWKILFHFPINCILSAACSPTQCVKYSLFEMSQIQTIVCETVLFQQTVVKINQFRGWTRLTVSVLESTVVTHRWYFYFNVLLNVLLYSTLCFDTMYWLFACDFMIVNLCVMLRDFVKRCIKEWMNIIQLWLIKYSNFFLDCTSCVRQRLALAHADWW